MTSSKQRDVRAGLLRRTALACALGLGLLQGGAAAHAQQRQDPAGQAGVEIKRSPTINTVPWTTLAQTGKRLVEEGRLGHETTVHLTIDAELDSLGGLNPETLKLTWRTEPDEGIRMLGQELVNAVSASRVLSLMRDQMKAVRITVELDRQNFSMVLAGETSSEEDASKMANGYGALLMMARITKKETPEGALYGALKAESEGRLFKMTFAMPKAEAARIVADMLARRAAREPAVRQ